jgi:hypothetical protein
MDVTTLEQIGPYAVNRFIDAGAFAWVFEVVDPKFTGRRLALKMLMPEAAEGEEFRRFESEARLLAQIDHPSLVTIFDFGRDDVTGNFYYVMTYVEGQTMKDRLKQGPMPLDEALPIFIDLLDGLGRLHENGIVHRDIKPANVLLGRDGRSRLADLGIARVQAERSQTRTGVAVGTALYMSPEQARGREVDPRSDLFSLGLTLYEALTGNVIYDHVASVDSTSGMDVLMYIGSLVHTQSEFDIRFDPEPELPEPVKDIIYRILRLSPDDRFQSAEEMRDALRSVLMGQPVVHHAPPVAHKGASKGAMIGGGALSVVLLLVGLYFFYLAPKQLAEEQGAEAVRLLGSLERMTVRAVAVSSAVQDMDPAPPDALLDDLDRRLDRAEAYLEDGKLDVETGSYSLALANLRRGEEQSAAVCQALADDFLTGRANTAAGGLKERAIAFSDKGAPEAVPEAWAGLTEVMKKTEATATASVGGGCEAADAQLRRIRAAEEASPLADAVEAQMATAWPLLAEEAYENAVTARMLAVATPAKAREYRVAVKGAKRFLLQGSRYKRSEEFQTARDAYRSAERGFKVAAVIAPAAFAQGEVRLLVAVGRKDGGEAYAAVVQSVADGDEAYAAEQWETATQTYLGAIARLKEMRAANEWRRAALAVQDEAKGAKSEAEKAGAQKSAPIEYDQAEVSYASALRSLESQDAKQAELGFAAARDEYGAAQKRAIQTLSDARLNRASVVAKGERLLGEQGCGALEAEDARAQCEAAANALAAGTEALEAEDAPSALRNFRSAKESYARAQSAQVLWDATRPRPPELVRRVPQRDVVRVSSKQLYSFAVEASDPNGDVLSYTWIIDEAAQEEMGPTMKRRFEANRTVSVKVDDGRGGAFTEEWMVEVIERDAP